MTGTAETEAAEFWEIYKLEVAVIPTHKTCVREDQNDVVYRTKREKYNAAIDEKARSVDLLEKGRELLSPQDPERFVVPDLAAQLSELEGR